MAVVAQARDVSHWLIAIIASCALVAFVGAERHVSISGHHACMVAASDQSIVCAGDDTHGQSVSQAGVSHGVSVGDTFSCGLLTNGTAFCWGLLVGVSTRGSNPSPLRVAGAQELQFLDIAAGTNHVCGLLANGTVMCFGAPIVVQATPSPSSTFQAISSGANFSCGVSRSGSLSCWGDAANVIVQVTPPGGSSFVEVAAGATHACALYQNGSVICWGDDSGGVVSQAPQGSQFAWLSSGVNVTCGIVAPAALDFSSVCRSFYLDKPNVCTDPPVAVASSLVCWGSNDAAGMALPLQQYFSGVNFLSSEISVWLGYVASMDIYSVAPSTNSSVPSWGSLPATTCTSIASTVAADSAIAVWRMMTVGACIEFPDPRLSPAVNYDEAELGTGFVECAETAAFNASSAGKWDLVTSTNFLGLNANILKGWTMCGVKGFLNSWWNVFPPFRTARFDFSSIRTSALAPGAFSSPFFLNLTSLVIPSPPRVGGSLRLFSGSFAGLSNAKALYSLSNAGSFRFNPFSDSPFNGLVAQGDGLADFSNAGVFVLSPGSWSMAALSGLTSVDAVSLSGNGIENLTSTLLAVGVIPNLLSVNLTNNPLSFIAAGSFSGLSSLSSLSLPTGGSIRLFPGSFSGASITTINSQTAGTADFSNIGVYVQERNCFNMSVLQGVNASSIKLDSNSITNLTSTGLVGSAISRSITTVSLLSNPLSAIAIGAFSGLSSLSSLSLPTGGSIRLFPGSFSGASINTVNSQAAGTADFSNIGVYTVARNCFNMSVLQGITAFSIKLEFNSISNLTSTGLVGSSISGTIASIYLLSNPLRSVAIGAFSGISSLSKLFLPQGGSIQLFPGSFSGASINSISTEYPFNGGSLSFTNAGVFTSSPGILDLAVLQGTVPEFRFESAIGDPPECLSLPGFFPDRTKSSTRSPARISATLRRVVCRLAPVRKDEELGWHLFCHRGCLCWQCWGLELDRTSGDRTGSKNPKS